VSKKEKPHRHISTSRQTLQKFYPHVADFTQYVAALPKVFRQIQPRPQPPLFYKNINASPSSFVLPSFSFFSLFLLLFSLPSCSSVRIPGGERERWLEFLTECLLMIFFFLEINFNWKMLISIGSIDDLVMDITVELGS
jgi:hypothetical protein